MAKYEHVVDDKGRVVVPADWRKEHNSPYLVEMLYEIDSRINGDEDHIFFNFLRVCSVEHVTTTSNKMVSSYLASTRKQVKLDSHGRIILSHENLNYIGTGHGEKVIMIIDELNDKSIQIFGRECWKKYEVAAEERYIHEMLDNMKIEN